MNAFTLSTKSITVVNRPWGYLLSEVMWKTMLFKQASFKSHLCPRVLRVSYIKSIMYQEYHVSTVSCTSDTCFAIHAFFTVITCMMSRLAPLTGLVVIVDRAWETSHIYLTTIWNINGMVHFIYTNNKFNVR